MSFSRPSVFSLFLVLFTLTLSACGGNDSFEEQLSDEGLTPELYLPGDVGMVLSYSLRNDDQRAAVEALQDKMEGQDFTQTVAESFNAQFSQAGLDYEKDLMPAFGESFRWIYAARPGQETTEVFSITTLEDAAQLLEAFDTLAEAGAFEKKILSERDVYISEEDAFYVTVYDDLLFMASDAQNLVDMVEQKEKDSLWAQDLYQEAIGNFGEEFILYGLLFPQNYSEDAGLATLSITDVAAVIDYQSLVVSADVKGLRFDVNVQANKEKAQAAGFSFDAVPRAEPYLYEEVPSEGLMAYLESYGLKQTLEEADKLEGGEGSLDQLRVTFRNYFGMDFDEEFMSFFDKAYAFALHENGGLLPGISFLVDVSSDEEHAQELINKLDGQISGLTTVFQESLPDAIQKDTVMIGEFEYSRVVFDLSSIPRTADSPIPSVITAGPIQLIYGTSDERLLISMAQVWEEEMGDSVADSVFYKNLDAELGGADQGLILLNADGLAGFLETLRALREQLGLEVSDQTLQMEAFLDQFYGAIARSETGAYSSTFTGYLMLAE